MAEILNQVYDVEAVRRDFPILSRTVHDKPLVYLDNGASAQKPQAVIDAVSHAYANEYANVHRGLHFLSNAATDAYENAREIVKRFLNAPSVDNVVFTKSTTEAINTVAYGYGSPSSARATRSSSPSWSTTPTSCPGISCASARGEDRLGRGRRPGQFRSG
jgi:cysteine desulfurase/selenocysteine lyase